MAITVQKHLQLFGSKGLPLGWFSSSECRRNIKNVSSILAGCCGPAAQEYGNFAGTGSRAAMIWPPSSRSRPSVIRPSIQVFDYGRRATAPAIAEKSFTCR